MKIGVILRSILGDVKINDRYTLNKELEEVINSYGGLVIGITRFDASLLDSLDGMILQGGSDYTLEDFKIIDYLYKNDIPTLGICLGMQTIAVYKGGNLYSVDNHYYLEQQNIHKVKIDKSSKFYSLIGEEKFLVNSRHHEAVYVTSLDIVGKSEDNIIEVVEDKSKKFFIGVEWHPETNFLNDLISRKIFDAYFNVVSTHG